MVMVGGRCRLAQGACPRSLMRQCCENFYVAPAKAVKGRKLGRACFGRPGQGPRLDTGAAEELHGANNGWRQAWFRAGQACRAANMLWTDKRGVDMRIAVIPARGGSKRIPGKNIKPFCGRPIIAWSIAAALESALFDRVVVSTDCDRIAETAKQHGAEVPFRRPAELSDDHTGTIPVVGHAVEWFRQRGEAPDEVCCIYATAPFVRAQDVRRGHEIFKGEDCKYAFSVTSFPFPIQRAIRITASGRTEMFQPEHFNTRSQDLEEAFHDAGQFYWGKASAWVAGDIMFAPYSVPVLLPRHRVQDIDTLEDWVRAEYLFKAIHQVEGD